MGFQIESARFMKCQYFSVMHLCEFANLGYFGGNTYALINISVPVHYKGVEEERNGDLLLERSGHHERKSLCKRLLYIHPERLLCQSVRAAYRRWYGGINVGILVPSAYYPSSGNKEFFLGNQYLLSIDGYHFYISAKTITKQRTVSLPPSHPSAGSGIVFGL